MTRMEFITRYTHEVSGPVMDVLFRDARGGELSLLVRQMMQKIDRALGAAYDELAREISLQAPPAAGPRPAKVNGNGAAH